MRASRISQIAGVGIVGFLVASGVADKVNLNPLASQVAGFAGAFLGSLFANRRARKSAAPQREAKPPEVPIPK